jgi:hypothetical protein
VCLVERLDLIKFFEIEYDETSAHTELDMKTRNVVRKTRKKSPLATSVKKPVQVSQDKIENEGSTQSSDDPWGKHDGVFAGDPYFEDVMEIVYTKRKALKA